MFNALRHQKIEMTIPLKPRRVMVGLSGGVDSAVAAWLLKEQGWQVEAVFMQNWSSDDPHCSSSEDLSFARAVCDQLSLPLRTVDFSEAYRQRVFQAFLDAYARGQTPNPDVCCNNEIKFKAFLAYAKRENVPYIATGHYVQRSYPDTNLQTPIRLYRGIDASKDQSYFLHGLNQSQLASSLFPIGGLHKKQVRDVARELGLANCDKPDSVGICFIEPDHFNAFLSRYLLAKSGNIETTSGVVIGKHKGLIFYTLGQRKGLGIGGLRGGDGRPWYVVRKDMDTQTLIVGHKDDPALYQRRLICQNVHWISGRAPDLSPFKCTAKVRYRQKDQACRVTPLEQGDYEVMFEAPVWAATPGQFIVFYQKHLCLGGGVIVI